MRFESTLVWFFSCCGVARSHQQQCCTLLACAPLAPAMTWPLLLPDVEMHASPLGLSHPDLLPSLRGNAPKVPAEGLAEAQLGKP